MEQPSNIGGWQPDTENFEEMRTPKLYNLSPTAQPFVPKSQQAPVIPQQGGPFPPQAHYQAQMEMHQPQPSHVQQRFAAAQGSVEPGGGGGGFDYPQMGGPPSQHHVGNNNGAMANGNDCKVSALQNRLSNMRMSGAGGGGGMSRGDNNGKDFNHHQHHQQPMPQHHQQQHRVQQQSYQPHQGGHHGHHHHQHHPQQAQLHQPYPYGVSYSNAINNHLNHPILGAANHHLGGGGGMSDNRKHNNGGGGGQQHHRSRQQQHQHQHHHHQHHQGSHHHQGGGGGGGGHGMMGGGNMAPMSGGGGGNSGGPNNGGADYNDDEQTSENQSFALDYLTEVIAELFDNPGMFEDVKQKLSTMFTDFRNDNYVLSNAVEMIFEQSIKESNFRYMGARLCQLLDSLDERGESLMRVLLRLKMEDQQGELLNFMKQEQVKVRGTTLFLAELYMQLRSPQHDLGKDIALHIIYAIGILLRKEGPENLKCVCQCLKLCGFELEQDFRDEVHSILGTLENLQSSIQSSVGNLIKSVLDLHNKSWGRSEEVVPVAAPVPAMPNPMSGAVLAMGAGGLEFRDSPVFYGPDGEVLTEEENSFLETNMPNKQNPSYDDYDDDDDGFGMVDDADPEVQLAFNEFLQSGNRPNREEH